MAPRISLCYVISRSISYAKTPLPTSAFRTNGSRLAGTRRISLTSFLATAFNAIPLCIYPGGTDALPGADSHDPHVHHLDLSPRVHARVGCAFVPDAADAQ